MALETGTYIDSLVATNPTATDALAQADDHLRLIKATLKATFPSITGAVTLTHTQINQLQDLLGVLSAPSGTRLLFQQATAPSGWTTDATHHDKALRIINGSATPTSGGTAAFSTAFASHVITGAVNTNIIGSVDSHPLTLAQMPSHRHDGYAYYRGTGPDTSSDPSGNASTFYHENSGHTRSQANQFIIGGVRTEYTGGTSNGSNGQGHSHGSSGLQANSTFDGSQTPLNLAVQYVDFIIAQKD